MLSSKQPNSLGKMSRRSFLYLGSAALATALTIPPAIASPPLQVKRRRVAGVPFYQTTIDLTNPQTLIVLGLANNSNIFNTERANGDESFRKMVARYHAAIVASGTFFGKNAQKQVLGNLVSAGQFIQYIPQENYGTTLGLRAGNIPEMLTTRIDGTPEWHQHWFSITSGPRLLRNGKIFVAPRTEGFTDPRVMGIAPRSAIGFPAGGKKLVLVTFLTPLTLEREAQLMRKIGCYEAMNLDGGSSIALAKTGKILVRPGRELTNVIVVYDAKHPAPTAIRDAWMRFQAGERPSYPQVSS